MPLELGLNIHLNSFFSAVSSLSAKEIGATMTLAMGIRMHGPLHEKSKEFKKFDGKKCAKIWDYSKLSFFVIESDVWDLNPDMFVKIKRGSVDRRHISPSIRGFVHERDGYVCVYCGQDEGPFHIDHIFPISKGGDSDLDNLCLACPPCNMAKSDKLLSDWLGEQS